MTLTVTDNIRELLTLRGIPFREVQHETTYTSEASAKARGEDLRSGAKAILLKVEDAFGLFVVPADSKLDWARIKQHFGIKKLRFATRDELFSLTGLVPGSVPPFGAPILPVPLYADTAVGASGTVAFNAGSLTTSMVMDAKDWETIASPTRFAFRIGQEQGSVVLP